MVYNIKEKISKLILKKKKSNLKSPLECSIFKSPKSSKKLVIYNHSFSGNRLEGISLLDLLGDEYSLLCYDIRGCGNNMSEFVTLGMRESFDLFKIIEYVLSKDEYKEIYLWGRSMGGATIIHLMHDLEYYI